MSRITRKPTMWFFEHVWAQTKLYKHRRLLEKFRKSRKCTIRVTTTKALISFAVSSKLICAFVFAHVKCYSFLMTRLIYMNISLWASKIPPIISMTLIPNKTFMNSGYQWCHLHKQNEAYSCSKLTTLLVNHPLKYYKSTATFCL